MSLIAMRHYYYYRRIDLIHMHGRYLSHNLAAGFSRECDISDCEVGVRQQAYYVRLGGARPPQLRTRLHDMHSNDAGWPVSEPAGRAVAGGLIAHARLWPLA
eukprot:scaffold338245_cov22-Prasinocladus_malaysianus.AAC.1